jgi:hypothetical protein
VAKNPHSKACSTATMAKIDAQTTLATSPKGLEIALFEK